MKKIIKFRIWDKEEGKLLSDPYCHIKQTLEEINCIGCITQKNSKYCLQESLNLYDINGKEIFEGDIVDLYAKKGSTYKPKAIHQASIRWVEDYAGFGLYQYKDGQVIPFYKVNPKKLRILGNILEKTRLQTPQKKPKSIQN